MLPSHHTLRAWFFAQPILLLSLTALFWAGNTIAGRLAIDQVSPLAVVFLRWLAVSALMVTLYGRQVKAEWPILKRYLPVMVLMGMFGFTAFNALFYIAAHSTTALNLGIIQGSMPMFVLLGALAILRTPIRALQACGVVLTMSGVAFIASQGDLSRLAELKINPGDALMITACLLYSLYAVLLRKRPAVSGMVFFTVLSVIAAIVSVPVFAIELVQGTQQWPTAKGWLVVAYITIFPSFLSQIFFMRGVELIGPGRAGVFINLVPIFSSFLAVALLGEPFHFYHAAALVLVLMGIGLSERKGKRPAVPPEPASDNG
ncbi:DMT family transporter [Stappia sp. ES.058]|uniref:DMT family transporter n=1 Tax=Stappia sp. ES.058 TaxID=1881061 RepID=UPI0008797242|nr:DMT family transporter [Stappia sp. ES.058]SDT97787.1 Permease of the drug/metabolite transporter (DMT) superfamily [Stappia sp. ES.058]